MVAILFNSAEPFEQIDNTTLTENPVRAVENLSEHKTFKDYIILSDNPRGQHFDYS